MQVIKKALHSVHVWMCVCVCALHKSKNWQIAYWLVTICGKLIEEVSRPACLVRQIIAPGQDSTMRYNVVLPTTPTKRVISV